MLLVAARLKRTGQGFYPEAALPMTEKAPE